MAGGARAMLLAAALLMAAILAGQPAAAQQVPHLTIHVDSDVYGPGETIHAGGLVGAPHGGAVTIQVISPAGSVVAVGQAMPDGRDWSWAVPAEFGHPGTYTILAHYSLSAERDRTAAATFVYVTAVEGTVTVNGTDLLISYTGDPAVSAYTDAHHFLIYLEFAAPGATGVMRLPDGLHEGDLVAVEGGSITTLPDGSYAYSADSDTLVLAADAVAVPEFGAALLASALAASAALPLARRLHRA